MKKYITEIAKDMEDTVNVKYCDNNAVNLILSDYINITDCAPLPLKAGFLRRELFCEGYLGD